MTADAVGAEPTAVKLRHFVCVALLARWGDFPREVVRLEVVTPRGSLVCVCEEWGDGLMQASIRRREIGGNAG